MPVANATVYVKRAETLTTDFFQSFVNPIIDSTTSDAAGNYELKFNKVPQKPFHALSAIKDGHSSVGVYCGISKNIPETNGSSIFI